MVPTSALTTETTDSVARGFAEQTPGEQLFTLTIFTLGMVATGAFVYYLFANPAKLNDVWSWVRSLPLVVQGVFWLLFLPWMIALWVWAMPWVLPVRLALVIAVLLAATWLLFPWK